MSSWWIKGGHNTDEFEKSEIIIVFKFGYGEGVHVWVVGFKHHCEKIKHGRVGVNQPNT